MPRPGRAGLSRDWRTPAGGMMVVEENVGRRHRRPTPRLARTDGASRRNLADEEKNAADPRKRLLRSADGLNMRGPTGTDIKESVSHSGATWTTFFGGTVVNLQDIAAVGHDRRQLGFQFASHGREVVGLEYAGIHAADQGDSLAEIPFDTQQVHPGLDLDRLQAVDAGLDHGRDERLDEPVAVQDHGEFVTVGEVEEFLVRGHDEFAIHDG